MATMHTPQNHSSHSIPEENADVLSAYAEANKTSSYSLPHFPAQDGITPFSTPSMAPSIAPSTSAIVVSKSFPPSRVFGILVLVLATTTFAFLLFLASRRTARGQGEARTLSRNRVKSDPATSNNSSLSVTDDEDLEDDFDEELVSDDDYLQAALSPPAKAPCPLLSCSRYEENNFRLEENSFSDASWEEEDEDNGEGASLALFPMTSYDIDDTSIPYEEDADQPQRRTQI